MKTICREIASDRQHGLFTEVVDIDGTKLRVQIKSDSYGFQSYARIEVLDAAGRKWNSLHAIHHSRMETPHELAYSPKGCLPSSFEKDRASLLRVAKDILGLQDNPPY